MTSIAGAGRISGVVDETVATLSFQGEELEPDEITARLGLQPTRAHRKGDAISRWRNDPHSQGLWSFELRTQAPEGPEEALSRLLAMLPADAGLWASLTGRYRARVDLSLVVKAWSRGFEMPAPLIAALAARGLSVWCEVYAEPQPLSSGCS